MRSAGGRLAPVASGPLVGFGRYERHREFGAGFHEGLRAPPLQRYLPLCGGSGPDLRRIVYNLIGRLGGDLGFEWLIKQVVEREGDPVDNGWRAIARFA